MKKINQKILNPLLKINIKINTIIIITKIFKLQNETHLQLNRKIKLDNLNFNKFKKICKKNYHLLIKL